MKIALVIQNADRRNGGAEGYTLDLARALGNGPGGRGHEVTVVAQRGPETVAESARAAGYPCVFLGGGPGGGLPGEITVSGNRWRRLQDFQSRVRDLYDRGSYDIVHAMLPVWRCDVYQPHSGLAADQLTTGHLKHPGARAQFFSWLMTRMNLKRRGLVRVEAEMMRHGPWMICSSSVMRDSALRHFSLPAQRLVRIMNGIDLSYFDPAQGAGSRGAVSAQWQVEPGQRLALLVGNNWKLKGVQEAIEALAELHDRRLVLMVVGKEDAAGYQRLAARLGVDAQVRFVGRVADLRTLYGAADFLLLPTRRDTCSLVVLEGLAMGLPVITTLQNGACEAIEDGRQGILLDRGNPSLLAAAMRTMMDDRHRQDMARHAMDMRQSLSYGHHVEQIEAVYAEVLAARRGRVAVG